MAEFLSPGVFIEEASATGQQVEGVGTSTMAILGWTKMGVVDTATFVSSFDDFQRKFGGFTNDSRVPIGVSAFFANGGARMYVTRVVPTDAVVGESCVTDAIADENIGEGDGIDPYTATGTLVNLPVFKGSVDVKWRNNPAGTITAENPAFAPAEAETAVGPHLATLASTPLTDDTITLNWTESIQAMETLTVTAGPIVDTNTVTVGTQTYTFVSPFVDVADNVFIDGSDAAALVNLADAINNGVGGANEGTKYGTGTVKNTLANAGNLTATTMDAWAILGGTAGNTIATTSTGGTVSWGAAVMSGGTDADAKTATLDGTTTVGGADAARISAASINRDTGALSITFAARVIGTSNGPDADSITVDYDAGGSVQTVTDDGAGAFSLATSGGTAVSGTIDYVTGDISVTWTGGTDIPFDGNDILVDYDHCQWELDASSEGAWASRLTLRVEGDDNFLVQAPQATADAGDFTKFTLTVLLQDELTGEDVVRETYEEVVFDDATDALYFPDLLNTNSDFISVTDSGTLDVPSTFKGTDVSGEVLGVGDATPTIAFSGTLASPSPSVIKTSMIVTYTPVATGTRTLVSDVNGNITGTGLDTTKTNSIDYATGAWELNFLGGADAPADGVNITAEYITFPQTSLVDYTFTSGSDGTLSGATFDRTVFSSPALQSAKRGMYAFDRIDEVLQLVIPDFAGDVTVAGDQMDYAEGRRDVFAILSTPQGFTAQEAKDYRQVTFTRRSKFAAMYWPWVRVADPLNGNAVLTLPPMAHIAGIYARVDQTKNVGKAPGGTVDGALRSLIGLESNPDKGERDLVYPARINPLINTAQTGLAVWGVRTLSATNDIFRYINAVRLFQFVEKSVFNSTHNFVFESINGSLYASIKSTIDGFLLNLFNTGHFAGNTPGEGFFVIVDSTNNPPEVVNAGQVIVDIGIAPNRPGEFIRFRFSQKTLTA